MNNNPIGTIKPRDISREMEESYLDYAMSVIVQRALPDVRDGLKPVHRRILYAMWQLGLKPGAKFRKSATVVGEVLGKYHPHGDIPVYDAMVRLAQNFSMRYPLVHGQGNFGSMDGDSAAAMRYTEAKLAKPSEDLLTDLERETVDFIDNYDGTTQEPSVLPAALPNLLLNGTVGIAVGMATNIPPHNLGELVDGIIHLIQHPDATVEDLMEFVKGPDFPTGAEIFDINEIKQAYATGRGAIVMRAKAEIIEDKKGGFQIIVTEIPYQVNKAQLIAKIAQLVQDKKIDGIRDLRDESDKDGVRVVIDLKKDSYPKKVLNKLFTLTQLQETFHVNTLALVDGIQPRSLTLKQVLEEYIKHREEVVRRRAEFDLTKAKDRAHILEGLKKALDILNKVIETIKKSKDREDAKKNLMKKFRFTEKQTDAILEMRLHQLTNLDRQKVTDELKDKRELIKDLEALLASRKKILAVITSEITAIKEKYGDERRTAVNANPVGKFTQEDLIPNEPTIIMITRDGYIKRVQPESFKTQGRGGKGVIGLTTKEEDVVEEFFGTNTHADLLFFTTKGRVFQLKAYDVPSASRTAKGQAIANFLELPQTETVTNILPLSDLDKDKNAQYLIMVTSKGTIKRVALNQFQNIRRSGLIAMKLKDDDTLEYVRPTSGDDQIILVSENGQAIRFNESAVRAMGRSASGVRGIKTKGNDRLKGMSVVFHGRPDPNDQLLVVTEKGYGKRTSLKQYKVQGRGGTGIKTADVTTKTGKVVSAFVVDARRAKEDLVIISKKGQVIRLPLKSVSTLGRVTQGVRLMRLSDADDKVANVAFI